MPREDFVGQTWDVFDNKRSSILSPADYLIVGRVLSKAAATSIMRNVFARKIGIVLRISSRLRYEVLAIISIITYKWKLIKALPIIPILNHLKKDSFLKNS